MTDSFCSALMASYSRRRATAGAAIAQGESGDPNVHNGGAEPPSVGRREPRASSRRGLFHESRIAVTQIGSS